MLLFVWDDAGNLNEKDRDGAVLLVTASDIKDARRAVDAYRQEAGHRLAVSRRIDPEDREPDYVFNVGDRGATPSVMVLGGTHYQ